MDDIEITEIDIKEQLRKTKNKKAAGPNGIIESDIALQNLVQCFNKILNSDYLPAGWRESKTTLVPKVSKPTPNQLRPIALLNTSYNMFMAIIKSKMDQYMINETKLMKCDQNSLRLEE